MKHLDLGPLPYGAGKTWHNRYQAVDFLKSEGGPYGVKLVLNLENANKLRNDLRDCVKLARKHKRRSIEIDARFGRRNPEKGFRLDIRLYEPEEPV